MEACMRFYTATTLFGLYTTELLTFLFSFRVGGSRELRERSLNRSKRFHRRSLDLIHVEEGLLGQGIIAVIQSQLKRKFLSRSPIQNFLYSIWKREVLIRITQSLVMSCRRIFSMAYKRFKRVVLELSNFLYLGFLGLKLHCARVRLEFENIAIGSLP